MFDAIIEGYKILEDIKKQSKEIIVFYSGGKDSLVVLDMCTKVFSKVICFYMYFVPGLALIDEQLDFARQKYGVEIKQIPHWSVIGALKCGVYGNSRPEYDNFPDLKLRDCYMSAMNTTGINFVATGEKFSDSRHRSQYMRFATNREYIVNPLKNWNKYDVLYYLKKEKIPLPDASSSIMSGISLAVRDILWLHDKHYNDFLKVEVFFPFVRAIVKRRDYYGIK